MSKWINEEDWPLVDYGEISEEEKDFNSNYVTESIPTAESDEDLVIPTESFIAIPTFHDPSLSSDHGRNAATASMGLEGPSVSLTPPASPDQPLGMQDLIKDVMVDAITWDRVAVPSI